MLSVKRVNISAIALNAFVLFSVSAHATQPPDPTASDSSYNTAAGSYALYNESSGKLNTAIGFESLYSNNTGVGNSGLGASTLFGNTSGNYNTASGNYALHYNTTGTANTATGYDALNGQYLYVQTGSNNTATGYLAMLNNSSGSNNTADGNQALQSNETGYNNLADGDAALYGNETGAFNVGVGYSALFANSSGSNNVALGSTAGEHITGSNNVDIASTGTSTDNAVIRIGTPGTHTSAFFAGISTSQITGSAVFVTSSGQLGVLASSERYKTAIASMTRQSEKLEQLRPVTFHLKSEPKGVLQYGLIAEEVNRLYPELVIRDDSGRIQGVRYDELAPILLNEVQRQQKELDSVKQELTELRTGNAAMQAAIAKLQQTDHQLAMR
jgi:hypothetical protein